VIRNDSGRLSAAFYEQRARTIPVRRYGSAYEDCSPIVAFLASEAAGYLNGQAIPIDGGLLLLA
jgi:NAD(P)-dependent dehydrogenase (short-subunit alcohol dehydrogenase family)